VPVGRGSRRGTV